MSSENILNQWLEEERQVRERLHPVGVIPIAQLAAYTGLEFLKKMLAFLWGLVYYITCAQETASTKDNKTWTISSAGRAPDS